MITNIFAELNKGKKIYEVDYSIVYEDGYVEDHLVHEVYARNKQEAKIQAKKSIRVGSFEKIRIDKVQVVN